MADTTYIQTVSTGNTHKKTKSSVFKAIVAPLNHKRSPSVGLALNSPAKTQSTRPHTESSERALSTLPLDHPHKNQPLAESNNNEDRRNSRQRNSTEVFESSDKQRKPKKSKSSTSLSALLSRPKSSKSPKKQEQEVRPAIDKENQTPPAHLMHLQLQFGLSSQVRLDKISSRLRKFLQQSDGALKTKSPHTRRMNIRLRSMENFKAMINRPLQTDQTRRPLVLALTCHF